MRVVVNAASAKRGGIVTYTNNLLHSLADRGWDTVVAVPKTFPEPRNKRVRLLRVNACEYSPIKRLIWEQVIWRRMVSNYEPDVLFSSANFGLIRSPVPQLLLIREGGLFDPFYLSNFALEQGVRSGILREWRRNFMLRSVADADTVMTPTDAMRDLLLLWAPQHAEKIKSNLYGTLTNSFQPQESPRQWREDGVLRLLYVSVYYPHKCPSVLTQAVEKLNDMGIPTHATITMSLEEMAKSKGGSLDEHLIRRAVEKGQVTLGAVPYDKLPELYVAHDAMVFTAVAETFGHPMAETMASGVPLVISGTAVNQEVAGDTAHVFRPMDPDDLVRTLLQMDSHPDMVQARVVQARARAERQLRWEDHVDRLVVLLEQIVKSRSC